MATPSFDIRVEGPFQPEGYSPPEDPLGELSSWELGLQRFFFEHNHKVALTGGEMTASVLFYPDVAGQIAWLPEKVSALADERAVEIDFPESTITIKLTPIDGRVTGAMRKFGRNPKQSAFEAPLEQVVELLRRFVSEVVGRAADQDYVTRAEVEQFIEPMLRR